MAYRVLLACALKETAESSGKESVTEASVMEVILKVNEQPGKNV